MSFPVDDDDVRLNGLPDPEPPITPEDFAAVAGIPMYEARHIIRECSRLGIDERKLCAAAEKHYSPKARKKFVLGVIKLAAARRKYMEGRAK